MECHSVIAEVSYLSGEANGLRIGAMTNEQRFEKLHTRKTYLIKSVEQLNLVSPGELQYKSALSQYKGMLNTTQDKPTPGPSEDKGASSSDPDNGRSGPVPNNSGTDPDNGSANPSGERGKYEF